MTDTVYLVVVDGFSEWQVGPALEALRSLLSLRVVTIGIGSLPVLSASGLRVVPEATLATVSLGGGAMIVLPPSDRWPLGEVSSLTAFLHRAQLFRSRIAAIGSGVIPLATAGVLRQATHVLDSTAACEAWLRRLPNPYPGVELARPDALVTTDRLVTARSHATIAFGDAVLRLAGATAEARRAWKHQSEGPAATPSAQGAIVSDDPPVG